MWDEKSKALLDVLPVGVLTVSGKNELLGANETGLGYLGLDEMAVGQNGFLELVENENLRKAIAGPANGVVRMTFPTGGRTYHAEVRPEPESANGTKVLILRDVSGVSNMAILRRHFVFDLLHKLRTPLTTILSVLSMATSGRLDPTRVDFNEILGMGARQAERLTGLLSRLKDLFLLETGSLREEMQIKSVPVAEVAGQVVEDLRASIDEKEQTVLEDYPAGPAFARADRETLQRALEMVFMNAHAFTPQTGEIRLSVTEMETAIRILVTDNGPGITADEIPIVFDRFRRGNSPGVRSVEGEGLGLYLARQLLSLQGGTILLDSKTGEGTTVEINLSKYEEPA